MTFSPELTNNVPATVLSVLGPPRVGPLVVWSSSKFNPEANHTLSTPTVSVDIKSSGMAKVLPCIAGKSAQKVGTILPLSYQPLYREGVYRGRQALSE